MSVATNVTMTNMRPLRWSMRKPSDRAVIGFQIGSQTWAVSLSGSFGFGAVPTVAQLNRPLQCDSTSWICSSTARISWVFSSHLFGADAREMFSRCSFSPSSFVSSSAICVSSPGWRWRNCTKPATLHTQDRAMAAVAT